MAEQPEAAEEVETLPECPRCDALKEQLAEMRGEFLRQAREMQQNQTQLVMSVAQGQATMQKELLQIIKEDRTLLKEVLSMRKV